jgi:glycosyltransferase involved in cell wall biosynthesis
MEWSAVKVLMSAFGCAPERGSEPGVGFQAVMAAAKFHDVWLLTTEHNVASIRNVLDRENRTARVHIEQIALGLKEEHDLMRFGLPGFHWHYDRWQRRAATRALELDREIDFDVVHHVTIAAYWLRVGVAALDKPLVWGPVGGAVSTPWRLAGELGVRGLVSDGLRVGVRPLLGRLPPSRAVQRRATIVFAQNGETAAKIRTAGNLQVLSNATAADVDSVSLPGQRRGDIVFVGRLIPLKGLRLAVRTLRYLQHEHSVLRVLGSGSERYPVERLARRWGVANRVRFEGLVPRAKLLEIVAGAGVLLYPALHDEASWSVAEALSLGTPVVCLARGGPAALTDVWPDSPAETIEPSTPRETANRLSTAVDRFLDAAPPIPTRPLIPRISFSDSVLAAYEAAVAGRPLAIDPDRQGPVR